MKRSWILTAASLLGAFPLLPAEGPPGNWREALAAMESRDGRTRQAGQAWLMEHLDPADLGPFLDSLEKRTDPEVRIRGVKALAGRLDLFPALAGLAMRGPSDLVRRALAAQVRRGSPLLPEDPDAFQPLPSARVSLGEIPRSPAQVAGLLARNLAFPLPLLVWPGLSGPAWTPPGPWGGEVRRILLSPGDLSWLQGGRVFMGKRFLLLAPPGASPPLDLPGLVTELLVLLGKGGERAKEAALALGQAPFLPVGEFFLEESASRKGPEKIPFLWGLSSFAARSGFGPGREDRAWDLLWENLELLEGEGLAWAAQALAALGPGTRPRRGGRIRAAWERLGPPGRWKVLLPMVKTSFPWCRDWLVRALEKGPASPREAACLVRALSLLGARPDRTSLVEALVLAGPGAGSYGARLAAPLERRDRSWALALLRGKARGPAELGACALGETPGWGWKALLGELLSSRGAGELSLLLLGMRTAKDRGAPGLSSALLDAWEGSGGAARIRAAVALGLLLDEGFFLASGTDPGRFSPVATWKVRDRFQRDYPSLEKTLEEAFRKGGSGPLRLAAARALGRIHGLHQDFRVGSYLAWGKDQEGRRGLFFLLREWVQVYPQGEVVLGPSLARGRWNAVLGRKGLEGIRIALGWSPPAWSSLNLEEADPLAWALRFPAE